MSLTKLFNYRFFFQNIKKSKSGIIFAMIILPLFTALSMLLISSDNYTMVMSFSELNVFNILFMYIIPIVLSISLFSFVFKKNSCDFVGSMPLSRKTIFTTNTIGGILIILLIQIITACLLFLTYIFANNLLIFGSMILDTFIYFTISYIFVFVTCNLAMSFSGNMFATIAATMLILFLVPFLLFTSRANYSLYAYSYYNNMNQENDNNIVFYDQFNFTAPSYFMDCMINSVDYEFNASSLIKMVVLSCAYFGIGLLLFNRKKYEMAEESYENDNIHLIVKFLTLTPFFAIGVEGKIINNPISFVFFFTIVAIYYFLFDIITKKKITVVKSIITFIVFSSMMYAIFALIVPNLDVLSKRSLTIDDVKSVTITSLSSNQGNSFLTDIEVEDKSLIYGMLQNDGHLDDYYYGNYTSADLTIKTNDGKMHTIHRADIPNFKKILEKYGNEKYELDLDRFKISLGGALLTKEDSNNLKEAIEKDLNEITYKELYSIINGDREIYALSAASYTNHKIVENYFNASKMKNTFETTASILNKNAYKHSTIYDFANMTYMTDFGDYLSQKNPDLSIEFGPRRVTKYNDNIVYENPNDSGETYIDESGNTYKEEETYETDLGTYDIVFDGLRNIDKSVLREYLYEHKDDKFDRKKPYFAIWFVTKEGGFYSNDIEGFYKIYAKAFNEEASENYGFKLNEG